MGGVSFGDALYLLISGELSKGNEGRMIEAILVSCCDHSLVAPSVDAARFVASGGVPLPSAVAAGILAVGDYHGGAIEQCAKMFYEAMPSQGTDMDVAALTLVREKRARKERVLGYGHPLHTRDPRVGRLFELARAWGLAGRYVQLALAVEKALEAEMGRRLPMNVDAAIAALMGEMGLDWRLGKGFFLIARTAGLIAHVHEEMTLEKPFREVDYRQIEYRGPAPRDLSPGN